MNEIGNYLIMILNIACFFCYNQRKSGWLDRISKGVYKIHGTEPSLLATVSLYNTQLSKSCFKSFVFVTPAPSRSVRNSKSYCAQK